jgi:hypothetical protein
MDSRGKIVEQGTIGDPNVLGRYVYNLKINHMQSAVGKVDEIQPEMEGGTDINDALTEFEDRDPSRQAGD